jgi:hypothetical protein
MKFTMFVRPGGTKSAPWREDYDFHYVRSMHDAIGAATIMIADWNTRGERKGSRHNGMVERTREVVAVEFGTERTELV